MSQVIAYTLLGRPIESIEVDEFIKGCAGVERDEQLCYLSIKSAGVEFSFDSIDRIINCVFLYAVGFEGFEQFEGMLPGNIRFSDSKEDLERKLGEPSRSGARKPHIKPPENASDSEFDCFLEEVRATKETIEWLHYRLGEYGVNFHFDLAQGGKMIFVTSVLLKTLDAVNAFE